MTALVCEAFAKVNRSLLVLGARPDGYHELDTIFQTIDLSDLLTFEPADRLSLEVDDPALTAGEDNLVLRAATGLASAFGVGSGARITLTKRIPYGAGLGGGSADAAATLLGLARLWDLSVPVGRLSELAAGLGSDVPFFLVGGVARGTGRGEVIEPLDDWPPEVLLLLSPPFGLPTPAVYRELKLLRSVRPAGSPREDLTEMEPAPNLRGSDPGRFPDRNDLEPAAESLRSEVRALREALISAGATSARLSGSGSTVFGVFPDLGAARSAASSLPDLPAGTRIRTVPTLSRAEFASRAIPHDLT